MTPREALWTDPAPRTPEGQRLWDYLNNGAVQLGTVAAYRGIGQRICQIEAEAVAARNAELAAKVRELAVLMREIVRRAAIIEAIDGTPPTITNLIDLAAVLALIEEVASPNREPDAL